MDDSKIIDMYFARNEAALTETKNKYGKYCYYIAYNILKSEQDAEECVNDTYLNAWNSIPPNRPSRLAAYLGKITRNLALNRYVHLNAKKRDDRNKIILNEINEIIPDTNSDGRNVSDELALKQAINKFLASLPKKYRIIFVRRYWYLSDIKEIATDLGLKESNVKVILHRTRNNFRAYLEKEGITI